MRTLKSVSGGNATSFAYDGQMGFEDVDTGTSAAVTDYAIGARGIDRISKTAGSTSTTVYPLYDGHGNMVGTLGESGTSYTTGDYRQYDAWGNILNSDSSGDPKGRYCANLGHKQDDESGLIYMRARYYDPGAGRFCSEDTGRQDANNFFYCANSPVSRADSNGKDWQALSSIFQALGPLLNQLGLSGLCKLVFQSSALFVADVLFEVSTMLTCAGGTLAAWGQGLTNTGSWAGSFAGAALGYAGAQATALGVSLMYTAEFMMILGDDQAATDAITGGDLNPEIFLN